MILEIGKKAPDFTLPSDGGKDISLHDYEGQKVILYFIPRIIRQAAPWKPRLSVTTWRISKPWAMLSSA